MTATDYLACLRAAKLDPEWVAAREELIDERRGESASAAFIRKVGAAYRMSVIERALEVAAGLP